MSATLPVIQRAPIAHHVTARRIHRCYADPRGVNVILDNGDVLVVAHEVVGLMQEALDVRDGRRRRTEEHLVHELAAMAPGGEILTIPTWFVALLTVLVVGAVYSALGLAHGWYPW